jgi:hypothetical protein
MKFTAQSQKRRENKKTSTDAVYSTEDKLTSVPSAVEPRALKTSTSRADSVIDLLSISQRLRVSAVN